MTDWTPISLPENEKSWHCRQQKSQMIAVRLATGRDIARASLNSIDLSRDFRLWSRKMQVPCFFFGGGAFLQVHYVKVVLNRSFACKANDCRLDM